MGCSGKECGTEISLLASAHLHSGHRQVPEILPPVPYTPVPLGPCAVWCGKAQESTLQVMRCHVERGARKQRSTVFLAPGVDSWKDNFRGPGCVDGGGGFRIIQAYYITVHFISIIIPSAPLRIIQYQIPEVGRLPYR